PGTGVLETDESNCKSCGDQQNGDYCNDAEITLHSHLSHELLMLFAIVCSRCFTLRRRARSLPFKPSIRSLFGIELRRASCRWRVTGLALSICEAGSHFHNGHVSGGPAIIPDGRISQVRLETLACLL